MGRRGTYHNRFIWLIICLLLLLTGILKLNHRPKDEKLFVHVNNQRVCPLKLRFSNLSLTVTALASFPGSGNSWLRHRLQQATGIYTGSVDDEKFMIDNGYLGEGITGGSVLVVKTHHRYDDQRGIDGHYKKAILLLRNPYDAILSWFQLALTDNHTATVSPQKFCSAWPKNISNLIRIWIRFVESWLKFPGPLHLVFYDGLKTNPVETLRDLLLFLDQPTSTLKCGLINDEGVAHRKLQVPVDGLYSKNIISKLNSHIYDVYLAIKDLNVKNKALVFSWVKYYKGYVTPWYQSHCEVLNITSNERRNSAEDKITYINDVVFKY
ncbi:WSCD family member AAEL009094 [Patella vulgata]|uniref:WSCD family member AAEL009094 n=1 Tax=Patella vulgata TaxID=6465 RepID=UPI0024A8E12E|nr:WSCD family member AAEL009094 [Patella vulgata]